VFPGGSYRFLRLGLSGGDADDGFGYRSEIADVFGRGCVGVELAEPCLGLSCGWGIRPGLGRWRTYTHDVSRLERITSNPDVCHGKPVVRGLRYPVADILQLLAGGMTVEDVLEDYPDLERDDVLAALEYGALAAGNRRIPLTG